jgi:hypothetical protein
MSKNGEAFTKPAADDIDAWLTGATLPVKTCVVYGRPDLQDEYDSLNEQLLAAQQAEKDGEGDDRLAGKSAVTKIAERMDEVREQMRASARTFKFRSTTLDEKVEIAEQFEGNKEATNSDVAYAMLAVQCVEPAGMTAERFKLLHQKIGDGYFTNTVLRKAGEAREADDVDVPFVSIAASVARMRKG